MVGVHLLLIRHGETIWNQENRWQGQADIPLSEAGVEQARSLALRLRQEGNPIAAVYASPLSRALRTAEIIAEALGLQSFPAPLWCEMNIGVWSGLTTAEVIARHAKEWEQLRAGEDLPRGGGETFAQFQQRIFQGAELLAEKHIGERVVVVTHGGPIRTFLLHCRGLPVARFREVEKIGNASLTEVVWQRGKAIIHRVNDMAHLEAKTLSMEVVDA
jgi:broad specificity phosphatase PhoE